MPLKLDDVLSCYYLHLGARPPAVTPERHQRLYFLDGETEIAGAADEGERMNVIPAVDAVAVLAALHGGL